LGRARVIEQRGRLRRRHAGIQTSEAARWRARCGRLAIDHRLGSEVLAEKLVELFVVIVGEVDGFLLIPVLAVHDQVGVVVEDPLDLDIGILVDAAPLLEELLDAGQPIQPSRIARDDLARLVSSRAMQRDERERQRLPDHHVLVYVPTTHRNSFSHG